PGREPDDCRPVLPPGPASGARPRSPAARGDDAQGAPSAEAGSILARRHRGGRLPPGTRRSVGRQGRGPPTRALLLEDLLRPGRPRAARRRPARRDRADRAALPVSRRGEGRARRLLPEPLGGHLGAGGTPEHGSVAGHPAPPRGEPAPRRGAPLHRPSLAREPQRGLPDSTPTRAGSDRPRGPELARRAP